VSPSEPSAAFTRAELEQQELFAAADLDALEPVLRGCPIRELAPAEILIARGARNTQLYLVLSGELSVHLEAPPSPPLTRLCAGATVGEISLIDGEPASAFVLAASEVRVLSIDEELLWILADSSHAVAYNLLRTVATRLRAGNRIIERDRELLEKYRFHASVDALTGLFNRYWLHKMLARQMERSRGGNVPLALLLVDVDHFKRFNDEHGHVAGDYALRTVAGCLRGALRPTDLIARYGGEEFAVLLPGAELHHARDVAERLREAVRKTSILGLDGRELPRVSVSIGVAALSGELNADRFLEAADRALYRAKHAGRDQVSV
jgi:diguanylate cyclase (GGDEF)-like protein